MEDVASRHVVPVADLETTIRNMDDNSEMVEEEFKRLPDGFVHPCEESRKPENTKKNRFKGYYPYDHNRVMLQDDRDGRRGDYINASFLDGYKKERYYIAAQGPYKPNIVDDFWRMIWQEGVKVVVMVTSLVEGGRMKCLQYWPEEGTQEYGGITVTMETVNELSDFTIRKLTASKQKKSMNRQIYHFNFTSWPDHGVPNAFSLLEFMWRVKGICGRPAEPIIVHCSAGIGRTGTYIAIESLLDQAAAEDAVDVVSFVSNMRGQRKGMIQTSDQYGFVYRAVTSAVVTGDTSVDGDTIRNIDLINLGTVALGNRTVEEHLQALESVPVKTKKKRTVLMPSYRCRYGFFLLVADEDKENLWAHVCNSNSCTVITLGKSSKGCMPTGNDPIATARQTATLKSSNIIADDIKLDSINSSLKDGSGFEVRHYRLKTGVNSPNVGVMIESLLQWTSDPNRRRCTIISNSMSESRLLVLLMNIASRLQDDGRVDVISNMRRLYREVGQTFFTEADVKCALKFAQLQIENLGIYANL
ncbi:receptor-type tyrosine-protein phosphatase alpha-like [Haliotis rubra]|uniref:receptor-type tyrosine-protein phosphatase alpha-like n=1 Tax=Haliotis rubra TaxID=36100 RepID=UPI001EE5965D|nr:receptor-type tyrosine-protein phosphatase alpha-like [Haliotis rubra]